MRKALVASVLAAVAATACAGSTVSKAPAPATSLSGAMPVGAVGVSITVPSPAFADGATIPVKYTCTSANPVSPPLAWSAVPGGTAELTLLVEDAEGTLAGRFGDWGVCGRPPDHGCLAA